MLRLAAIAMLFVVLALPACETGQIVPEPGAITLEDAMASVGRGLVAMKEAQDTLRTGLIPSHVEVTFNISATATDARKLYVEVGAPALTTTKAGGEVSTEIKTSRGNQITIKFTNLLFAGENTLVQEKDAEEILHLLQVLNISGLQVYLVPSP